MSNNKPTWEEVKQLSPEEARAMADRVAPEGVTALEGEAFISLSWFMAKKFFPEAWAESPLLALTILCEGLITSSASLPEDELRDIAEAGYDTIVRTQDMVKLAKANMAAAN